MKKIKKMTDMDMLTDIEATLVLAVLTHTKNEESSNSVDVRTLIHNFAEALLLRDMFVNSFPELGDYPGDEEIGALSERAWEIAIEMKEGHG